MWSVQGNVPPPLGETVVDRGSNPHTQVTMKDHCLSPLLWILGTPPTSTVSTLKDLNPASKYQLRRELLAFVKERTIAPTIIVHNLQSLDRYAFCAGDVPWDLNTPVHYFSCQCTGTGTTLATGPQTHLSMLPFARYSLSFIFFLIKIMTLAEFHRSNIGKSGGDPEHLRL